MSQHKMNTRLRNPIMVRSNSSGFLNTIIIISAVSFGLYPTHSPYYQALFCYLTTSPVPTCLVHNCKTSRGLLDFHLLSPLFRDQIPFDPHQWNVSTRSSTSSFTYSSMNSRMTGTTSYRSQSSSMTTTSTL